MGAAPAPDFRWLQLRVDAEGKAPTEINDVKDLLLEPAMGAERPVIEVDRLKADVEMAVDVVAGAEVRLRAPVAAKPPTEVSFGLWALLVLSPLSVDGVGTSPAAWSGPLSASAPSASPDMPLPPGMRIPG
jgi:hypothetical protein